jgi:hypothetical protein
MDDDERRLFGDTLGRACRSFTGAALDRALLDLGWTEAVAHHPHLAVSCLFEPLGRENAASSALDAVVASALRLETGPSVGLVRPALGRWDPPGHLVGDRLGVAGLSSASLLDDAATAWVVASTDDGPVAAEVAAGDLTLVAVGGMDPGLGLVEVSGHDLPVATSHRLEPGGWTRAVTLARLAVAHQLVGAARAMLELARSHALARIQFGRPIAGFQAVRHRLADTLVAIEAADAALGSAWDEGSPAAAASAKALAGRTARTASRHGQQVLAGMGFTTEHDLHRYVRRTLVLDQLFGTSRALTRELGRQLLLTRQLPPLPPL